MTAPFDIEYLFTIILPPIYTYCTQHPIAIDRRKLSLATHRKEEQITHVQLAWLQAVTEFDFQTFDSIDPVSPDLLARMYKLQECFRIILQTEIAKNPEQNEIERKSIPGEFDTNENAIYRIPLMIAVKLLNTVLNQETRDKIIKQCDEVNLGNESKLSLNAYFGEAINIAVVQYILPELLPDKSKEITDEIRNSLCKACFKKLPEILTNNCAIITNIKSSSNNKEKSITGEDEFHETIDITFDAFRQRFKKTLLPAYIYALPCQKANI